MHYSSFAAQATHEQHSCMLKFMSQIPMPIKTSPTKPDSSTRRIEPNLDLLAKWTDSVFEIPGTGIRFGLDAIVGLIPGLGDTLTSFFSLYILTAARRHGVPRITVWRMAMNLALDFVLGSLPFLGDMFDVYWKANEKNVALLKRHAWSTPAEERRSTASDWLFVGGLIAGLLVILIGSLTVALFLTAWLARLIFPAT